MALLEVNDLRTQFLGRHGRVHAVDGVSFSLDAGRTLAIVGESGCGKSATALSIMRLLPSRTAEIVGGSVRFDDRTLTTLGRGELENLRGNELAMIFQDPMTSLNPTMTIGAQIVETLRRHLDLGKAEAERRAVELLEEVEITDARRRLDDYPHTYSGGMRQRVMIAIAVACRPRLLIADEPTTALDVTVQANVLDLLHDLQAEHEMALLLITHDMGVVAEMADDVLVMYAGQVVEQAPVLELFDHPEHPYTEALLAALPQVEESDVRQRLAAIPGRPPSLLDPPPTCRFAPRCTYASLDDGCAVSMPELREIRPGHFVRSAHPCSERARVAEAVS
jgi:oligopeptide/dipeptide ABC transporter ATP-binding protein